MAVDVFLKIKGIPGESRDVKYKESIEIQSFSWGMSPVADETKLAVSDFSLAKQVDKASPTLMIHCARKTPVENASLHVRQAGDNGGFEFLTYELTRVYVSSYQQGGSSGDTVPVEEFSLNYEQIKQTYTPQKDDGSADKPVSYTFDVKEAEKA